MMILIAAVGALGLGGLTYFLLRGGNKDKDKGSELDALQKKSKLS